MTDTLRRVQEWLDGGGDPTQRAQTEEWIRSDAQASALLEELELQGTLLREALQEPDEDELNLWDVIGPSLRQRPPAWRRSSTRSVSARQDEEENAPSVAEMPEGEDSRGWLLWAIGLSCVALLLVSQFMSQQQATTNDNAVAARDDGAIVVADSGDPGLEIESLDAGDASVMVYSEAPDQPTIIWVNDD